MQYPVLLTLCILLRYSNFDVWSIILLQNFIHKSWYLLWPLTEVICKFPFWKCLQSAVLHSMGFLAPSAQSQSVEEARTLLLLDVDWCRSCYWCWERWSMTVIVSSTARLAALPAEPTTKHTSQVLLEFLLICISYAIVYYVPQITCILKPSRRNFKCCLNKFHEVQSLLGFNAM